MYDKPPRKLMYHVTHCPPLSPTSKNIFQDLRETLIRHLE